MYNSLIESVVFDLQIIILLTLIKSRKCSIVSRPKHTITSVGETNIRLECSTDLEYSIIWQFAPVGASKSKEITFGEVIDEPLELRYRVDTHNPGHYDLVLPKVDIHHGGRYSCYASEGDDLVGVSELIVILNSKVNCSSNGTDYFCSIDFCGNFEPLWTEGRLCYDDSKTSGVCPSSTDVSSRLELQDSLVETCDRNKQLSCTCISTFLMNNTENINLSAAELTENEHKTDGNKEGSSTTLIAVIVSIGIVIMMIIIAAVILKFKRSCQSEGRNNPIDFDVCDTGERDHLKA